MESLKNFDIFDVRAAIYDFCDNHRQIALELPRDLTCQQRKLAKEIVGLHSNLRCESFGFGMQRKLHIFKCENHRHIDTAMHLGKTSSDHALSFGEGHESTGVAAPMQLTLWAENDEKWFQQGSSEREYSPSVSTRGTADTPRSSTSSHSGDGDVTPTSHDAPAYITLPESIGGPPGLPVRNTFIHFGTDEPMHVQISKSVPHSMKFKFGHLLAAEASSRARRLPSGIYAAEENRNGSPLPIDQPSASVNCSSPFAAGMMHNVPLLPFSHVSPPLDVEDSLLPGTEVVVEGLTKAPHFNGLHGVVQLLDAETGRYDVLFRSSILPGGQQVAKVKRTNLRLIMSLCDHLPVWLNTGTDEEEEDDEDPQFFESATGEKVLTKSPRRRRRRGKRRSKKVAATSTECEHSHERISFNGSACEHLGLLLSMTNTVLAGPVLDHTNGSL